MGGQPVGKDGLLTTEKTAARLALHKPTLEVRRMRLEGPVFRKVGVKSVRRGLTLLLTAEY
jgi:hypothetical protein